MKKTQGPLARRSELRCCVCGAAEAHPCHGANDGTGRWSHHTFDPDGRGVPEFKPAPPAPERCVFCRTGRENHKADHTFTTWEEYHHGKPNASPKPEPCCDMDRQDDGTPRHMAGCEGAEAERVNGDGGMFVAPDWQGEIAALRSQLLAANEALREARLLLIRYHTEPICSGDMRLVCGCCITLDEIDAALKRGGK